VSAPIKAEVLQSLYRHDGCVVTGIRFTYAAGPPHMRFIASGLWPESEEAIPHFTSELVRISRQVTPAFDDSAGKEVWIFVPERAWLAEFINLTAPDLAQAGLDSVTLLDRDLNCVLHLLRGRPLASQTLPYAEVRKDTSLIATVTDIDLPKSYERLDIHSLSDTMQAIIRTALEIYGGLLVQLRCIRDGGPRLLLTFAANVPSGVTTVILNLQSLEREVHAGLTMANLKIAIDVIKR
jgi:hypothetical protein